MLLLRSLLIAVITLSISGCATFSQDGGLTAVSAMTRERIGYALIVPKTQEDAMAADSTVRQLLAQPLQSETAVQIALLNNRSLRASLAELGISEADLVQAGRLRNPGFGFSHLQNNTEVEIERVITFDLAGLITMPARVGMERRRFEQVQSIVANEAIRLAGQTRRAYYMAVAANQTLRYMAQVKDATEAGSELARSMAKAGNWSKLEQAREQLFHADATAQFMRAQHALVAAREELARELGVADEKMSFQLPERLPDLPKTVQDQQGLEERALNQRLDLQSARQETEALAKSLGLTRITGTVDAFEIAYRNKSTTAQPRSNGYEISLSLPIFDWGDAKTAKAEALYMQSLHRTADMALRVQSDIRETYSAYRTAYGLAKYYGDEVVPLQQQISDEMQLRYNGMLLGVFELLTNARQQITSINASIEALRDFWLADVQMQMALSSGSAANIAMSVKSQSLETPARH